MQTDKKCLGCGLVLQYEDERDPGYAVKSDHLYCQACFKLKHYGKVVSSTTKDEMPVINKKGLIVLMTSVLHLDQLFAFSMKRHYPDHNILYVINHVDLLPEDTNLDKFLNNIKKEANHNKIFYSDIILMSSIAKNDISNFKDYLRSLHYKDIFLMGIQNSGKTTLFKALTNQKDALAMKKAGLTQEEIIGKFEDITIHDMPGLFISGYLHEIMDYEMYKEMIPDKTIKPKIYSLRKDKYIHIQNLVSLSHLENLTTTYVLYLNEFINVRRLPNELDGLEYENKVLKIPKGKHQITLADFGFIHIEGPLTVKMVVYKGLHISLTKVLFNA